MAESSGPDYSKYILPAGLLVLAAVLYEKVFGTGTGTQASQANQNQITQTDQQAAQSTLTQVLQTQSPTLSAQAIASMANSIFSYGQTGNPVPQSDQAAIYNILLELNNNADWYSLIASFGTKSVSAAPWYATFFSLPGSSVDVHTDDLPTYLRGVLSADLQAGINNYFSTAGITYTL